MDFLGMGSLEIVVILLVAFIFLGPERMIGVAKALGKLMAEMRRMTADLPSLVIDEEEKAKPAETPIVHRGGGPNPDITSYSDAPQPSPYANTPATAADDPDAPVPFQRPAPVPDNPEEPPSNQESA